MDPVDITFVPALALIVLDDVRVSVDLPEEAILIARMLNYVDQKIDVKYDDEKKSTTSNKDFRRCKLHFKILILTTRYFMDKKAIVLQKFY